MKKYLLQILLFMFSITSFAQQSSFFRTYSGNNDFGIGSMDTVHDGGYILCGSDCEFHGCNFTIIKVDSLGNEKWRYENNQYTGNTSRYLDNVLLKIRETLNHNFIAVGIINSDSNYNYNAMAVMVDSNGSLLWNRNYEFGGNENFVNLYLEDDTTYTMVGSSSNRTIITRIDTNGDTIWTSVDSLTSNTTYFTPSEILKLANSYFIGGKTDSVATNFGHLTVKKYSSTGYLTGLYDYYDTANLYSDGYYRLIKDSMLLINSIMKRNGAFSYYSKLWDIDVFTGLVQDSIIPYFGKFDSDSSTVNIHGGSTVQDSMYLGRYYINKNTHIDYSRFYNPSSLSSDVICDKYKNILACGSQSVFGNLGFLAKSTDTTFLAIERLNAPISIVLFPNPSNQFLHVKIDEKKTVLNGEYVIDFYSASGSFAKSKSQFNSNDFIIDISTFTKGLYVFRIKQHDNIIVSGKFIIN